MKNTDYGISCFAYFGNGMCMENVYFPNRLCFDPLRNVNVFTVRSIYSEARYCHDKLSVCPSVCDVCGLWSQALVRWNSLKIIWRI